MVTDSQNHQNGLSGQGETNYSSAAWRAGDSERQRQQSLASGGGDASPASQYETPIAQVSGILFAIVGGIIGWNQSGKVGALIGFIAGAIGGGVLAQFRVGRYIVGAIIVGTILFVGAAIIFGPTE